MLPVVVFMFFALKASGAAGGMITEVISERNLAGWAVLACPTHGLPSGGAHPPLLGFRLRPATTRRDGAASEDEIKDEKESNIRTPVKVRKSSLIQPNKGRKIQI